MIRYLTAGESHGEKLCVILEGLPSGLTLDFDAVDKLLNSRQTAFGRGKRQEIEHDKARVFAGVCGNVTTGAPIAIEIKNKVRDFASKDFSAPRPGHADLAGAVKYNIPLRQVAERASARETAVGVAAGAVCLQFLAALGVTVEGKVVCLAGSEDEQEWHKILAEHEKCGDTCGGTVEVRIKGLAVGLGSYTQWDKKADGRLAGALMSIQSVKAVEVGLGVGYAKLSGSLAHDEIVFDGKNYGRNGNNAGGVEGGVTNGQDVVLRLTLKPVPTIDKPLHSVDIDTKKPAYARTERHDTTSVFAAAVIASCVAAITVSDMVLEKTGGDSMTEIKSRWEQIK